MKQNSGSITPPKVSYRLTAPCFDSEKWGNYNTDGAGGLVINEP